jgi:hypothetical protein
VNLERRLRRIEARNNSGSDAEFIEWMQSLEFDDLHCVAVACSALTEPPAGMTLEAAQARGQELIAAAPFSVRLGFVTGRLMDQT